MESACRCGVRVVDRSEIKYVQHLCCAYKRLQAGETREQDLRLRKVHSVGGQVAASRSCKIQYRRHVVAGMILYSSI